MSLQNLDKLIREGKVQAVRDELKKVNTTKVVRSERLPLANLARRVGDFNLAIRLLNKVIRPKQILPRPATPEELIEYAVSLTELGISKEAVNIFKSIDETKFPEILLYRSFSLFREWNYQDSIPLLAKYISADISKYQKLVGMVNLAAAYIAVNDFKKASEMIKDTEKKCSISNNVLLLGLCANFRAQINIIKGDLALGQINLDISNDLLKDAPKVYRLVQNKWQAVLESKKTKCIKQLETVKKEALQLQHWETVRDCDLFIAMALENKKQVLHLYAGTPFEHYRDRIINLWARPISLPTSYNWNLDNNSSATQVFDLALGQDRASGKQIKPGKLICRTIVSLCCDLYHPIQMGALFCELYPTDHFNPDFSAERVYETISRTKKWLAENKIPLKISQKSGQYYIQPENGYSVEIPLKSFEVIPEVVLLKELEASNLKKNFSANDVIQALGSKQRTTIRQLSKAVKEGQLIRIGKGKLTRYSIAV